MSKKLSLFLFFVFGSAAAFISAQTHVSVPLDHSAYSILELAQTRGLCDPLPAIKPYTRAFILETISVILASEKEGFAALKPAERDMLENIKKEFEKSERGMNWQKGAYHFESVNRKGENWFSGDVGVSSEIFGSGAYYFEEGDESIGTNSWLRAYIRGDIGDKFSYDMAVQGVMVRAPRDYLGINNTYYKGFTQDPDDKNTQYGSYIDKPMPVYSLPVSYFPYTFTKNWDGFVFGSAGLTSGGLGKWPADRGAGSTILAELGGAVFGDTLRWRFGRLRREWGGMDNGSSLQLNSYAQPFVGLEATFNPAPWFAFSSLTGILEYYYWNDEGSRASAWTMQNAFSIEQVEFNWKNYLHFDFGSTAIWPKRFELGYIFPLYNNFMYQNNLGDFDNMGLFFNLKGTYPGLGSIWLSAFADEIEISSISKIFEYDRHMFIFQAGIKAALPWLPFASVKLSYTKNEPYNYTHTRVFTPWNNSFGYDEWKAMDTSYVNGGAGLGYYLPPNADEILVRVEALPLEGLAAHLQYQLIRHGAAHGAHQVDGSTYLSELDPDNRSTNPILRKSFLHDGAYQWMHIIKAGASYRFPRLPLSVFGEAGIVYSYYTDVPYGGSDSTDYLGKSQEYKRVDTAEYPEATGFILNLGVRIFP